MPLKQKIFALVISICFILFVIELVRRKKVEEEYTWLWILTGCIIMFLVIDFDFLLWLTHFIGAVAPTSTLFFGGIFFLLLLNIQFSIKISSLSRQLRILAQENALLKGEIEELKIK
ncbi:MAG TPA: DUF2304 domain-containing protein [Candidatus Desulfofervidus auxilii]|uniref:DUF2304 domain-containing protein n=1 Tax=Desulfofervidus auxilii TaxID=1621989 RepID=A0A7C1ZSM7_DESA2|nr:DUF2304 domain-containing protein [Candidatus Desulfofervidus auxilii]RKY43203.1 MAG: DUF2304 domain-containing protein [Candidatus Omnitrophota bacterium]HEC67872.1 DUF2304 domain-containing protein [Candidatus Desulfofervidus auxilii]